MTVFLCEDSLDGILTGVYEAWDSRLGHENVKLNLQSMDTLELFCLYQQVEPDLNKAEKVLRTVRQRLGTDAEAAICCAAVCPDIRKADAIYRMIVLGLHLKDGRQIVNCLQNRDVLLVMKLRQKAWNEAHRMMGFLRFEELENGVLYGKFRSPCAVLSLIAPHFADRFRQENWMIHDLDRGLIALHRKNSFWVLTEVTGMETENFRNISEQEEDFQHLWKTFCKGISIEERKNPRCQQNLLLLRFRPCMTEFQ